MDNAKIYYLAKKYIADLDEVKKNVFDLYYSPDKNMSQKEITVQLGLSPAMVCRLVNDINIFLASKINNTDLISSFLILERNKYSQLINNYGIDKVKNIINSYNKSTRQILNIYLEENRNITYVDIPYILKGYDNYKIIDSSLDDIKNKLQPTYADFKSKNRALILSLIEKYGKDKVYKNIDNLSETEKNIIKLHLGSVESPPKKAKEINEMLNITYAPVSIYNITKKIEDAVKHNKTIKKKLNNKERFDDLINTFGKATIINKIKQIKGKRKQALILYFGLDNDANRSMSEIQDMINIPNVSAYISEALDRLEKLLKHEPKQLGQLKIKEKFYNFIDLYGEKEVIKSFNQLNDKCKKIVNLYYGLGKSYPMSQKEIDLKLNINDSRKWLYYSLRQMENFLINPKVNPRKLVGELTKSEKLIRERKKTFKDLIKSNDLKKINSALKQLDKNDAKIIFLYFGLNNKDVLEKREMCEKFNINNKQLKEILDRNINKINNIISKKTR